MEPALGAAAAPGAPPTRYRPGPAGPGRAGADPRRSSGRGAGAVGDAPPLEDSRCRRCGPGGWGGGGGQQRVGRRKGSPGPVAGERRGHPSPPRPHSVRAANLRRAAAPRRPAPGGCGAHSGASRGSPSHSLPGSGLLRRLETLRSHACTNFPNQGCARRQGAAPGFLPPARLRARTNHPALSRMDGAETPTRRQNHPSALLWVTPRSSSSQAPGAQCLLSQ